MDAIECLKNRQCVRVFDEREVTREEIETIIDAGRLAATARNDQPWEFVVVTDKVTRKEIANLTDYGLFVADAPVCILVFCKDTKYYLEDGSAATENIMLAATSLGLGSCWVAGDKKPYCKSVAKLLGVPDEEYKLVSIVPIGRYGMLHQRPQKRKLVEVLHWDKF